MAAATLVELQVLVARMLAQNVLDIADNPNYPEATLTAYLNDAQNAVLRELNHDWFKSSETLDSETGWIELSDDILAHVVVAYDGGTNQRRALTLRTERYLEQNRPNWRDETGEPTEYIVKLDPSDGKTKIWLVPQPTATTTDGLLVTFTPKAEDLSADADEPTCMAWFPEFQRTTLPFWACSRLLIFDGADESDAAVQKYVNRFNSDIAGMHRALGTMFLEPTRLHP